MTRFDYDDFVRTLSELLATLPADAKQPKERNSGALRDEIAQAIERLGALKRSLDPVAWPPYVLDPADPVSMGQLIARVLVEQEEHRLSNLSEFYGSGVYALYYRGDFHAYLPLTNSRTPIYVGCADPEQPSARTPEEQGKRLARRLKDHQRSISRTTNLDVTDFTFRFLVVVSAWQKTAEERLIDRFKPVWNNEVNVCQGFGKHGDDPTTRANARSPWDTLHPGRQWAERAPAHERTANQIADLIAVHFRRYPPESK